jgi:HrpA-like RNA helicase
MQPQLNYIQAAIDTVVTIVKNEGRGDVLVFLPGMEVRTDVHACVDRSNPS